MSFLSEYDSIPPYDIGRRVSAVAEWIRTDTRAFYAELRERRPILRTPAFTLVTRHFDVLNILLRPLQFSVRLYGTKMDEVVGPFMLGRDGAVENYLDKSLMRTVMPLEDLAEIRRLVNQATEESLPEQSQVVDIIAELTRRVPLYLCDTYFGFPGPDEASMLRWSKATQSDFFKNITNDPGIHAEAVAAGKEMRKYIDSLLLELGANDDDSSHETVISRLLNLANAGLLPLGATALVANIAGLLVGSVETTSQAVAQSLREILIRPSIRERALSLAKTNKIDELAKIVWEALRFNPINPLLFRYCEQPTKIGEGTEYSEVIDQGTIVFACTASAMWDEAVVDNADKFREDRPSSAYIHFGYGSHECLGKQISEVMVPEIIRTILLRNPSLIDGPAGSIDFKGGPFPESFKINLGEVIQEN